MTREGQPKPPEAFQTFARFHPAVLEAYEDLGKAVREAGPLSDREIALVKLAIAVGARMEGPTHAHSRKALAQGIDDESLRHVVMLAATTVGFPTMMAGRS